MPVIERPLDANGQPVPPSQTEARYWLAGMIGTVLLVLVLRAIFPPAPPVLMIATATAIDTEVVIPPATLAPLEVATFTPNPSAPTPIVAPLPSAAPAAPAPVEAAPGCPAAEVLPAGASAGWLARAASCPHLVLANVRGVRKWVQRPDDLSDDIFQQLPEVAP
jgi:hypothetical protein